MQQVERLQKVQDILEQRDLITIPQLEVELDASKATVYRDIKILQKEGKVQFVRGGISKASFDGRIELPYHEKRTSNVEEKQRIAREAAEAIHPNSTVFLDSSTTVVEMVKHLDPGKNIKVITNDLMVGSELAFVPGIETHVLGGMIRKGYFTLVGLFTQDNLKHVQIDTAFFGTDAISLKGGLMLINTEEIIIKQYVMEHSAEKLLLADHTKFNTSAFISFCNAEDMDQIITGGELDDAIYNEYTAADISLARV